MHGLFHLLLTSHLLVVLFFNGIHGSYQGIVADRGSLPMLLIWSGHKPHGHMELNFKVMVRFRVRDLAVFSLSGDNQ
mgnify:CR=1 FL=1